MHPLPLTPAFARSALPRERVRSLALLAHSLIVLSQKVAGVSPVESDYGGDSRISMLEAEMDLRGAGDSESRFAAYVEGLASVIGHADRAKPLRDYCTGLVFPCSRNSVEPVG